MENKEPDSRLSVRKQDFEDPELYRLNQVINDLYSKVSTARDETDEAARRFTRSGVISSVSDSSAPSAPPVVPGDGLPQVTASDWSFNPIVYSAGEDGQQYGFVSITVTNKPPKIDYFSLFIQDYSSGYVNTAGTAVTLTSDSKSAGTTFENCVAGQVININSVAYTIASTPVSPYETLTLTSSAGTQSNVYFNLNPVDGAWQEIAPNAETGEWVLRPPTGLDVPACVTASTAEEKTYEPADGINYKRLVLAPWGDAPQLSAFTVNIEQQTQAGVPSGRFVVNFTKPLDPEYYYSSIERLWYVNNTFTGDIGATAIVDVSGTTVTYNTTSPIYGPTFKGQYFNYLQPGDTVYISAGPTLSETNTYIISEVISNTQLKLTTAPPAGTGQVFAQWIRIAAEANSFRQNDYWPLPTNPEYWKFRARSVNHRERANNTGFPTVNVTVPNSSGITQVAPGVITAAAFASTIRPVDLITTAGISLTSVVVAAGGVATVTTSSAHGLATGRQVAIYGGLGNASKLNGLFSITNTGANTFTITTSGVLAGTYTVGLFEAPLPALPSAIYPNGAVAFLTANTRLYRSSGSAWTAATDGGDIVANSITAGQIAAGAISTTELFAGEILVGQGGGKPTLFKVVDSGGTMIGFIGDISTPTYPVSFTGGYFQNLLIAPTLSLASTPRIYATSAGTMELVGVTIQSTNVGTAGFDPGTVIISPGNPYGPVQVSSASISSLSAVGPNYFTARSNNPGNFYPYCELYRTSSRAIVRGFADPFFASFFELSADATPASSYANFKSVPIQINSTTVIDSSRNGSFVNLTLTGSLTAGGGTGSSGQVLTSTGTGVQWTTAAAGTLTSINGMAGPAITIAAGSGISIASATNTVTITNSGVTSITGTANQVIASSSTGGVTLSLPQDIGTSSNVTFGSVTTTTVGPTTLTALNLRTDNATRWSISSTGMLNAALNDTYDIGNSTPNRVRTVYAQNVDTRSSGVPSGFVRAGYYKICDITGLSGEWEISAVASGLASNLNIKDNSGNLLLSGVRNFGGSAVNYINFYTNLQPFTTNTYENGTTSLRWSKVWSIAGDFSGGVIVGGDLGLSANMTFSGSMRPIFDGLGNIGDVSLRYGSLHVYDAYISSELLAGGSAGSSGQLLASTGSGSAIQWQNISSRLSAGTGISISGTTTATITNSGVTSITGTANQVIASASTGSITLSLPQSIATTSNVAFNQITLTSNLLVTAPSVADIGSSANYFQTLYVENIEAAPAGVVNNYVKVRKLDVADISGGSGFWDHQAVASISASAYTIRDNAGSRWISGSRQIVGLPDNTTNLFTDLIPSLRSTASGDAVNDITLPSLGLTTARWSSIWGDAITITNTVSASTVSGTTMNATQYNVYTDNVGDIGQPALRFGNVYTYGITLSGAVTAGGSTGSSGQLLASTGSGVQWQNIASRLSAGTGISISGTTTATITNSGVTSITGTSNQVIASASTGGVTLSLPQSIATTSSVTFNSLTLANGSSNGILIKDTGGTARVCLTIASDNNLYLDNNDSSYDIYIRPGSGRYTFVDGSYFAPFTNNGISLGYDGQGWSNVYSYNYWTNDGGTWYQGIDGTFDVTTSNTLTIRNGIITAIT